MKYLFGVNKKKNSNNIERFTLRRVSGGKETEIDNLSAEGKQLEKEKTIPSWVASIAMFLMPLGGLCIVGLLLAKDGFQHALQDRGWMFFMGIGLFVIGLVLYLVYKIKNKNVETDSDVQTYVQKVENTIKESRFELDIPETSIKMDVIFAAVKENKNGEEKIDHMVLAEYINLEINVFIENDYLCFADNLFVAGVPLDSIGEISEINKRMQLPQWNKSESFKSDKYKQYEIYNNQYGFIWIKKYYNIPLLINGEEYYFYLPNYEISTFKELIAQK